jgi:hypothetical protein
MRDTDPEFWEELTTKKKPNVPGTDVKMPEDNITKPGDIEHGINDSDLSLEMIVKSIVSGAHPEGFAHHPTGGLMSIADAERLDEPSLKAPVNLEHVDPDLGHGKHTRTANRLYKSSTFWRHHDNDDSDAEVE